MINWFNTHYGRLRGLISSLPASHEGAFPSPSWGNPGMSVTTQAVEFPTLPSLAISPNLQALLEFDDRLRTSSESQERPRKASVDLALPGRQPSRGGQEVPTVSLPPPRRKKSVVTGVPVSPKTTNEFQSASSSTDAVPEEPGGLGEIMFARAEDVVGDVGATNPYLNSPPSPPRYFYPRLDDAQEGIDHSSAFYTLEKRQSAKRQSRQRSSSDQTPTERKGGQLVPRRFLTSLGRSVGSRPKEKGQLPNALVLFSQNSSNLVLKVSGPRAVATRPLLLHSHKPSFSSSHSHQVRSALIPARTKGNHLVFQTVSSYEPSSSPEPHISISRYFPSCPLMSG